LQLMQVNMPSHARHVSLLQMWKHKQDASV